MFAETVIAGGVLAAFGDNALSTLDTRVDERMRFCGSGKQPSRGESEAIATLGYFQVDSGDGGFQMDEPFE